MDAGSPNRNRHGLSRSIPSDVARAVRQQSGFGCVVCGHSITDYEHIDPEFADAKAHVASGITLLCPSCHAQKTRKWLSTETIKEAMLRPKAKEAGFSYGELDPALVHPVVIFAGNTLRNCIIPVEVYGHPLFLIEPPEAPGAPFRLSATFFDKRGNLILTIARNQWQAFASGWDISFIGGVITVRSGPREVALQLRILPRFGVEVEKLDMWVGKRHIVGDSKMLMIDSNGVGGCLIDNAMVGISIGANHIGLGAQRSVPPYR